MCVGRLKGTPRRVQRGFRNILESPRSLQDGPRALQDAQDGPKIAQEAPKRPEERSNRPPETAPRGQNRQLVNVFEGFWHSQILGFPTLQEGSRGSDDRSKIAQAASKNTRVTGHWPAFRGLQMGRTAEGYSKTSPEGPKEHLRRPRRPPRRPKSAPRRPRWPQDGPSSSQETRRALQ